MAAALRETDEELGLALGAGDLQLLRRVTTGSPIQDVYLARIAYLAVARISFGPDVAAIKWATRADLERQIADGAFPTATLQRCPERAPQST